MARAKETKTRKKNNGERIVCSSSYSIFTESLSFLSPIFHTPFFRIVHNLVLKCKCYFCSAALLAIMACSAALLAIMGIVESVAGNIATVIEGNTSPGAAGSQDNGGGVYRRTRGRSTVTAYIRPMGNEKEETMTGEEIYNALQAYLKTQPLPEWAREELEDAMQLGITDGESPMLLIPRYQAAIMAKRAAEHAIMAKRAAEQK